MISQRAICSIGYCLLFAHSALGYSPEYANYITERYLSADNINIKTDEIPKPAEPKGLWDKIVDAFTKKTIQEQPLSEKECIGFAFKISPLVPTSHEPVINERLVSNLELVEGLNPQDRATHLVHQLISITNADDTTTSLVNSALGTRKMVEWVSQPTIHIPTLQKRQNAIKQLVNNNNLRHQYNNALQRLRTHESDFFAFWQPLNQMNEDLFKNIYFGNLLSSLNKNSIALEIRTRLGNLLNGISFGALLILPGFYKFSRYYITPKFLPANASPKALAKLGLKKRSFARCFIDGFKDSVSDIKVIGEFAISGAQELYKQKEWKLLSGIAGLASIGAGYQALCMYTASNDFALKRDIANYLQTRMIGIASFLQDMKALYTLAAQDPILSKNIASLQQLQVLVQEAESHSDEFNKLVSLLDTRTFKGNASFFSLTGRVLAAYELMKTVKDEFVQALDAIGELDAYVTIANLMVAHQNTPVRFCFAEFIPNAQAPYLQTNNFWNCFVSHKYAVPNNIELGGDHARNMVLTGPNTGGKSTVIKAVLLDIILAQTFGIAAADSFVCTPFAKITGYMNITDDIALGASRFKAEVLQSKAQINTARSVPSNQFSFNARDEGIVGTDREVGEKAEYIFSKQLGEIGNSLSIMATHYPKLIELESKDSFRFKNFHMEIILHPNGRMERTYLLKPGFSRTNIALNILMEEGVITPEQASEIAQSA